MRSPPVNYGIASAIAGPIPQLTAGFAAVPAGTTGRYGNAASSTGSNDAMAVINGGATVAPTALSGFPA